MLKLLWLCAHGGASWAEVSSSVYGGFQLDFREAVEARLSAAVQASADLIQSLSHALKNIFCMFTTVRWPSHKLAF